MYLNVSRICSVVPRVCVGSLFKRITYPCQDKLFVLG